MTQVKVSYTPTFFFFFNCGKYPEVFKTLLNVAEVTISLVIYLNTSLYCLYNFGLGRKEGDTFHLILDGTSEEVLEPIGSLHRYF